MMLCFQKDADVDMINLGESLWPSLTYYLVKRESCRAHKGSHGQTSGISSKHLDSNFDPTLEVASHDMENTKGHLTG